jgi:tetratricopeptide (TPR) repeat protein
MPTAPLPAYQRLLRAGDARKAGRLEQQLAQAWAAGRFEEGMRVAEALFALRRRVQGEGHWQVRSAHWRVDSFRRILQQPAGTRKQMADAPSVVRRATQMQARGRLRDAQALWERLLPLYRRALGEDHPDTALAYDHLAANWYAQGRYARAQPLFEKALAIHRNALREDHPNTAVSYAHLAQDLYAQGQLGQAQPLCEKALAIDREALGEHHPKTATSYHRLALNLFAQGRYAEAQPGFEKAVAIRRQVLGDDHAETAASYNRLALNRYAQGQYAQAQPELEKALAIRRKVLGEDHLDTAASWTALALNLSGQGRYLQAQMPFEKALTIHGKLLGDDHPDTAAAYGNLAVNLSAQGRCAQAQPLLEKSLAILRQARGDDHSETGAAYNNLALNLSNQGQNDQARPLVEKALAIRRRALGEDHPDTAAAYQHLAAVLDDLGQYAAAQPLYEKSLAITRKVLGAGHPDTGQSYTRLAVNLYCQGRYDEAATYWSQGTKVFSRTRLLVAAAGLERAAVSDERSPLPHFAAVLARAGKAEDAWRRFEESLARGTWDDLSARLRRSPADRDRQIALVREIRRLDQLIERSLAANETPEAKARRAKLLSRRRHKGDELARFTEQLEDKYGPVAGQLCGQAAIQKALPADAALVGWLDILGQPNAANPNGEHWAVLLRARGRPVWQRLRGSGKDRGWTDADTLLPFDLRRALREPGKDWYTLAHRLRRQRLQALEGALAARDGLPAARRLVVLPSPAMAGVPLEVCAADYTVSYAPSGTILAYLRGLPPAAGRAMLALADPVCDPARHQPGRAPLPAGGLLVTLVVPHGNAARAGLHADDVLLCYAGSELKGLADIDRLIGQHAHDKDVRVTVWRAGQTAERTVAGGPLGVALGRQPAPEVLAERYKNDQLVAQSRGEAEGEWPELPGTRAEGESLRRLCGGAALPFRLLADSDASEQQLDRLARSNGLAHYRYIHLATHGDLDDRLPLQSAVILSRDHLPDPLKQLEAGQPVYTGRLTAEEVLEGWDLHADLVTLSACQTALGKYQGGEGFVGFTQALLLSGTRSVCLSLWKVDDTATALLMQRFYANLLGQRPGLKKPLGKAEALAEAKRWLRELTAREAARQAAALTQGVVRGKGRKPLPQLPIAQYPAAAKAPLPYAHPYYWAAFVLVGDDN